MTRQEFEALVLDTYGIAPDYPFSDEPHVPVFRHPNNRKWFAIMMHIPKSKLGLAEAGYIDIVDLKCAIEVMDSMWGETGIFPAYHMNRTHWLSVALDGSVDADTIQFLLSISYDLTAPKIKKKTAIAEDNPLQRKNSRSNL